MVDEWDLNIGWAFRTFSFFALPSAQSLLFTRSYKLGVFESVTFLIPMRRMKVRFVRSSSTCHAVPHNPHDLLLKVRHGLLHTPFDPEHRVHFFGVLLLLCLDGPAWKCCRGGSAPCPAVLALRGSSRVNAAHGGSQTVRRLVEDGRQQERHPPRCGFIHRFGRQAFI